MMSWQLVSCFFYVERVVASDAVKAKVARATSDLIEREDINAALNQLGEMMRT